MPVEFGSGFTNGGEPQRMNFDAQCCDVLFLEFSRQVSLDEGSLRNVSGRSPNATTATLQRITEWCGRQHCNS